MFKFTRITSLIALLWLSIFTTHCSCDKKDPNGNVPKKSVNISELISKDFLKKDEEFRKKNIEEILKKMRAEREKEQKKLLEEERQLVKAFSKNYSLTPEQTEIFSTKIESSRNNNATVEKCDNLLKIFRSLKNDLESANMTVKQDAFGTTQRIISKVLIPNFTLINSKMAKEMLTDLIPIIENAKKQLELRSKLK